MNSSRPGLLTRLKAAVLGTTTGAVPYGSAGRWTPVFSNWLPESWQADEKPTVDAVTQNSAVFACVTLIASDIAKLRPRLVQLDKSGIWLETSSPAFSPVLRKPNRWQNHIQFKEAWMVSKLLRGNAYALKQRDDRGVVVGLLMLDPCLVLPLVTTTGEVYYQLGQDNLSGVQVDSVIVAATEIIHDRFNCLYHPLVGLSPLHAAARAADQGLKMERNQSRFFANSSVPGGVLTAPGSIPDPLAARMKAHWEAGYTGDNAGRIAVLGDGLKFEAMRMTAVESQLADQVGLTAKAICSTFHVPSFMVGIGEEPTYSNGETRTGHYYSQCLQAHIEQMELCLDEGLGIGPEYPKGGIVYGVELDLSGLDRMDPKTQAEAIEIAIRAGAMTPNHGARLLGLPPNAGGDVPYLQQQMWPLSQLANRPLPTEGIAPPALPAPDADTTAAATQETIKAAAADALADFIARAEAADIQRAERESAMERRHAELLAEVQRASQPASDEDDAEAFAELLIAKFQEAAHAS